MSARMIIGRLIRGAAAGAALVALVILALHSGYDSQTLGGGVRLRDSGVATFIGYGAAAGAILNAVFPA